MVFQLNLFILLPAIISLVSTDDNDMTLHCHRRQFKYTVQQSDPEGRKCWDTIHVMSCWGRCDSNEIPDWMFPYKKSHHPVCMHSSTEPKTITLRNCDPGVAPDTWSYTFKDAATCACSFCKTSQASCEGLRYRGMRRDLLERKKIKQKKLKYSFRTYQPHPSESVMAGHTPQSSIWSRRVVPYVESFFPVMGQALY